MATPNFLKSYLKLFGELVKVNSEEKSMALAVGGEFEAVGALEYCLLRQNGLQKTDTVVDIGCGSGRLAFQLKEYLGDHYIGFEIVPELYKYAEKICKRSAWKFLPAPGLEIPLPDNSADFICFFSVLTHLLHEESYKYLEEAKRVIKPGGKIIFSFLEFGIPSHWTVFEGNIADMRPDKVLNQFIERSSIQVWAGHLGLQIIEIADGDKPHIVLDRVIRWESGAEMKEKGNLGQSVCILTK